ncbi:helix-turn-helix domain-containing protein [Pseudoalteromonas sp. G4]|uniref:helix-turn-helix domain-containing protein n=1 Tax=Pseudoalteromonas sp. G4 TaxID=2992761 RepID=UPI00237E170A|nr:AraC family transcriptional regulator [Pseudoalteromonas sp. G4]MDE3270780.1 AraC family transcriptional regulator [Pseudoalteromonas sp. G4]
MQQFNDFFLTITFSCLLVSIVLLLPQRTRSEQIKLFMILLVCCNSYVLGQLSFIQNPVVDTINFVGGNLLPGVFWLVCICVFADKSKLTTFDYSIACSTLLVPSINQLVGLVIDSALIKQVFGYFGVALELSLIAMGLFYCIKNIDIDLVAQRRSFRTTLIFSVGIYFFLFIILGQGFKLNFAWLTLFFNIVAALISLTVIFVLFGLRHPSPFELAKVAPTKNNNPLLTRIVNAMEQDALYKQEGLTISDLSKRISIHVYKLRQLINGELGFRNFNDYLNYYRIREITELLGSETHANTPVLTLALDNGFRSLSSFNKAFKDTHGKTPTQYKKEIYG